MTRCLNLAQHIRLAGPASRPGGADGLMAERHWDLSSMGLSREGSPEAGWVEGGLIHAQPAQEAPTRQPNTAGCRRSMTMSTT